MSVSLGYDIEPNIVNAGDTATLRAFLYDKNDTLVPEDDLVGVEFTVQAPDKSRSSVDGLIEGDGLGVARFDATEQVGHYVVVAAFSLMGGETRSSRTDFEVIDPFAEVEVSPSYVVAVTAWKKLEDCFDAEDEGPWLRDMTLNYFNKDKMESFIDEALFDINYVNPPTDKGIGDFVLADGTATGDLPLLAQGVFMCVLRHIIRSYVEQPNPVGAQIAWHDRRDYLQRWQSVYQIEYVHYDRMLKLWKRQFLGLGKSALLLSSKAGRLMTGAMRTRYAGRGYYW